MFISAEFYAYFRFYFCLFIREGHIAGFCALCAIQKHVSRALQSTGRSLAPKDLVSNLRCILFLFTYFVIYPFGILVFFWLLFYAKLNRYLGLNKSYLQ